MDNKEGAYPNSPGHRGIDTSKEAAVAIAPKLGRLQSITLQAIRLAANKGATAHELCDLLGMDGTSIQPRISELRRMARIEDSGQRRRNISGVSAIVWIAVNQA